MVSPAGDPAWPGPAFESGPLRYQCAGLCAFLMVNSGAPRPCGPLISLKAPSGLYATSEGSRPAGASMPQFRRSGSKGLGMNLYHRLSLAAVETRRVASTTDHPQRTVARRSVLELA